MANKKKKNFHKKPLGCCNHATFHDQELQVKSSFLKGQLQYILR